MSIFHVGLEKGVREVLKQARDVSYAVRKTEERESLRKFLKISSVPAENEIYTTLSQYDPEYFISFVPEILNALYPKRKSG